MDMNRKDWEMVFRERLDDMVEYMWGDGNTLMLSELCMTEKEFKDPQGVKDTIARHMANVVITIKP